MNLQYVNDYLPVGTPVNYHPVIGQSECVATKTGSPAWQLGHGEWVVLVEGKTGGVALRALTFDCHWCKEFARLSCNEYRFPVEEIGGFDQPSGKPICEGCAESAWEEAA